MSQRQRRTVVQNNIDRRNSLKLAQACKRGPGNSKQDAPTPTQATTSTTNTTTTTTTNSNTTPSSSQPSEAAKQKRKIIEKVLSHKKKNGASTAFNLDLLVDGWLELESDPDTFNLLIEDFGCHGAQVEEVYDLDQKFEGPVFGFIFLFKWLDNQHQSERSIRNQQKLNNLNEYSQTSTNIPSTTSAGQIGQSDANKNNGHTGGTLEPSDRDTSLAQTEGKDGGVWSFVRDDQVISKIFFAKQMISNSCATHALISVLLNCDRRGLNLGPVLNRLKEHTRTMNPENKGYAIGNLPELAKAHNSHASYSSLYCRDRPQQRGVSFVIRGNQRTNLQQLQNQPETYHFVSYVPINNHLYELDGLKNYPIDHGPIDAKEGWTEKFRKVIKKRLLDNKSSEDALNDIRYNLMAVVPDKRVQIKKQTKGLERHIKLTKDSLKQIRLMARSKTNDQKHRTTATMVDQKSETLNRPSSPVSNGTLTASETGSVCSPGDGDIAPIPDVEIPNPPYSPLSNATLTASESGSCCGDFEDSFILDEKEKIDRFFMVKFDSKQVVDQVPEEKDAKTESSQKSVSACNQTLVTKQNRAAQDDLKRITQQLQRDVAKCGTVLKEELDKRRKYKIDNSRKTHNYEPFILTFLSLLAKQGNLADLIEQDLGLATERNAATPKKTAQKTPAPVAAAVRIKRTPKAEAPVKVVKHSVPLPPPPKLIKKVPAVSKTPAPTPVKEEIEPPKEQAPQEPIMTPSGRPQRRGRVNYKVISSGSTRGLAKNSSG